MGLGRTIRSLLVTASDNFHRHLTFILEQLGTWSLHCLLTVWVHRGVLCRGTVLCAAACYPLDRQ